jgi:predicted HAD superfamily Cof-like phosphohydrolase
MNSEASCDLWIKLNVQALIHLIYRPYGSIAKMIGIKPIVFFKVYRRTGAAVG